MLHINNSISIPIIRVDCMYQKKKTLLMFKLVSIIPSIAWNYCLLFFLKKVLATSSLFFNLRIGKYSSSGTIIKCHQKESEKQIIFPSISLSLWLHTLNAGFHVHPLVHGHQYLMCNQLSSRLLSSWLTGFVVCTYLTTNKQTTFINFKQELKCPNI